MAEQTKSQRREQARQSARLERERKAQRARRLKWMLPTAVSLGLVAIVAIVAVVIVTSAPAPQSAAGPRNMVTGGMQFVGESGEVVPVETAAIPASGTPTPTDAAVDDGIAHITLYADLSCPACKGFEETYNDEILALVAAGDATYELQPVAILDSRYAGSRYSSRANNVAACVADLAPESFLDVVAAMFANQPEEGTTGLGTSAILDVVHGAGVNGEAVDRCITDDVFDPFVQANTDRATSDPALRGSQGFSTPTLVVDGVVWDRSVDALDFIKAAIG